MNKRRWNKHFCAGFGRWNKHLCAGFSNVFGPRLLPSLRQVSNVFGPRLLPRSSLVPPLYQQCLERVSRSVETEELYVTALHFAWNSSCVKMDVLLPCGLTLRRLRFCTFSTGSSLSKLRFCRSCLALFWGLDHRAEEHWSFDLGFHDCCLSGVDSDHDMEVFYEDGCVLCMTRSLSDCACYRMWTTWCTYCHNVLCMWFWNVVNVRDSLRINLTWKGILRIYITKNVPMYDVHGCLVFFYKRKVQSETMNKGI